MFNLDDFDKIFYDYEIIDEEVGILEESLLREANAAKKNVNIQVGILRKTNQEQLSLQKNNDVKNKELAEKFNETVKELRSSHLMLGLIKIGLYELNDVMLNIQSKKYLEDKNKETYQ